MKYEVMTRTAIADGNMTDLRNKYLQRSELRRLM